MTESNRVWLLAIIGAAGVLLYLLSPILSPFLVGALLAYLGDPITDKLEKLGLNRTAAVIIVFFAFSCFLILFLLLLIPLLGSQIEALNAKIPAAIHWLKMVAWPAVNRVVGLDMSEFEIAKGRELVVSSWEFAGDYIQKFVTQVTKSSLAFFALIGNLALIPVVAFYLLRDWDNMVEKIRSLLPRRLEKEVVSVVSDCDEMLGAFLKGQLLVMLALGVIYGTGLWLIGLDLAVLIGMASGLASIIPYLGFFVGIVAALVAAFFQFGDVIHLVLVVVVFAVGQLLEGSVLTPLLVGDRIGLHPVAVIFAILAGAQLFGFVGMLLALPVAAVTMVLVRRAHDQYIRSPYYQGEAD